MASNDWKSHPPYSLDLSCKAEEYTAHTGSCNCSRINYSFKRREPLDCKYCHCRDCRRLHGAPYQHAAIFHKSDDLYTPSSLSYLSFYSSTHDVNERILPCKVYCSHCHSPIMDEGRRMLMIFPSLVNGIESEEKRKDFEVKCHIFYAARVVDVVDGKDKWSGHKGTSKLMSET